MNSEITMLNVSELHSMSWDMAGFEDVAIGQDDTDKYATGVVKLKGSQEGDETQYTLSFGFRAKIDTFARNVLSIQVADDVAEPTIIPPVALSNESSEVLDDDAMRSELTQVIDAHDEWKEGTGPVLSQPKINERYSLPNDTGRDVSFVGQRKHSVSSHSMDGPQNMRWTDLVLYSTQGGIWICHEIGRTRYTGEVTRYHVHVAKTDESLINQVGTRWLAKELYEEAGIVHEVEIE